MSHKLRVTNQVLTKVEARFGCERREPKRIRYNVSRNLQQSVWGGPSRWEAEQLRRPLPPLFRGILSAHPKRDVLPASDAATDHGQTGKIGKGSTPAIAPVELRVRSCFPAAESCRSAVGQKLTYRLERPSLGHVA